MNILWKDDRSGPKKIAILFWCPPDSRNVDPEIIKVSEFRKCHFMFCNNYLYHIRKKTFMLFDRYCSHIHDFAVLLNGSSFLIYSYCYLTFILTASSCFNFFSISSYFSFSLSRYIYFWLFNWTRLNFLWLKTVMIATSATGILLTLWAPRRGIIFDLFDYFSAFLFAPWPAKLSKFFLLWATLINLSFSALSSHSVTFR